MGTKMRTICKLVKGISVIEKDTFHGETEFHGGLSNMVAKKNAVQLI